MKNKPTDDDIEMAQAYLARVPSALEKEMDKDEDWLPLARLIAEVRTEQRDFDAAICEQYAENTTFIRKCLGAKECAVRIRCPPVGPLVIKAQKHG